MADLKVGDVVQLKSGGPNMTIDKIAVFTSKQLQARCVWFDEKNKQMTHVFELEVLEKA
jgi:uncharacterized protein YodC (DUF2158 family)